MPTAYHPPSVESSPEVVDETSERSAADMHGGTQLCQSGATGSLPTSADVCETPDREAQAQGDHTSNGDTYPPASRHRSRSGTVRGTAQEPLGISNTPPEPAEGSVRTITPAELISPECSSDPEPYNAMGTKSAEEDDGMAIERPSSPSGMSTLTSLTASTANTNGSGSSSGSGSTVTRLSYAKHPHSRNEADRQHYSNQHESRAESSEATSSQKTRPDVMSFLDHDSPPVRQEAIRRSPETTPWRLIADMSAPRTSPTAQSTSSVGSSFTTTSDVFSEASGAAHDTDGGSISSPDQSVNGGDSPQVHAQASHGRAASQFFEVQAQLNTAYHRQRASRTYGTPEMPRGSANHPHVPPSSLQSRASAPPAQGYPKHLPRAEKLPLAGYELLASKLCGGRVNDGGMGGSGLTSVSPMYRRFEALNHRLLLYLQDELAELEEQIHRLDTADTQTRRLQQNGILPASRRQEAMSATELQWHKTDTLGKIGFKLGHYNHVLSSFKETQALPSPDPVCIDIYRAYLAAHAPIVESETRFLDAEDDLVSLARSDPVAGAGATTVAATAKAGTPASSYDFDSEDLLTPMPRPPMAFPPTPSIPAASDSGITEKPEHLERVTSFAASSSSSSIQVLPVVTAVLAAAFLLPILAFSVIPSFVARMTVVVFSGLALSTTLMQGGLFGLGGPGIDGDGGLTSGGTRDLIACVGVYGAVMAVVAAAV